MKTIMKLSTGIGLILLLTTSACVNGIVGNGDVETRSEDVHPFNRLYIQGNFDVHLTQAKRPDLVIKADENLQDYIEVRQTGNKLTIACDRNIIRAKRKDIYISMKDLQKLDLAGAVELQTTEPMDLESLSIFCSGASDIYLELEAERLRIDVSGATECDLEGQVDEASLVLAGAGDFNSLGMEMEELDIDLSGAASARVFVTERLHVDLSGAGSIKYKGDPEIRKSISGIGSLRRY